MLHALDAYTMAVTISSTVCMHHLIFACEHYKYAVIMCTPVTCTPSFVLCGVQFLAAVHVPKVVACLHKTVTVLCIYCFVHMCFLLYSVVAGKNY